MIGVQLDGRLGNQMFQYAYAYACAEKTGSDFFVMPFRKGVFPERYFTLKTKSDNRLVSPPISAHAWLRPIFFKVVHQQSTDTPETLLARIRPNTFWYGYFQSEKYFQNIREHLVKFFSLKPEFASAFEKEYQTLCQTSPYIAVHIRRTDYVRFGDDTLGGKDLRLPKSYYSLCLDKARALLPKAKVIFMSDDMTWVKENFPQESNFIYSNNNEIIDFQLLLHADASILSPSSFSWWAAYLNQKPMKQIFAPRYWIGFKVKHEYPVGITLSEWNWIDVLIN